MVKFATESDDPSSPFTDDDPFKMFDAEVSELFKSYMTPTEAAIYDKQELNKMCKMAVAAVLKDMQSQPMFDEQRVGDQLKRLCGDIENAYLKKLITKYESDLVAQLWGDLKAALKATFKVGCNHLLQKGKAKIVLVKLCGSISAWLNVAAVAGVAYSAYVIGSTFYERYQSHRKINKFKEVIKSYQPHYESPSALSLVAKSVVNKVGSTIKWIKSWFN